MNHEPSQIKNKTCLVTGATSGIGKMAAYQLAKQGLKVIVASRDGKKCARIVEWIVNQTGNMAVDYAVVDLSEQEDIHRFAREIHERYQRLDMLINNAGSFFLTRRENSAGIEMTFALNHLGYFSTTLLLLDLLEASAPARIVNVASGSHRNSSMHYDDLQCERRYRPFEVYGQSKLANILFTHELARRMDPSIVTVNSVHPGVVATEIASDNFIIGWLAARFMWLIGKSPAEGARTPVYLATSKDIQGVTGKYFIDCEQVPSAPHSYDEESEKLLWDLSLELTGLEDPT
jgi:NAD(P)-dependent dehydrogenase (short-subunit alcohol dehydrogenase family)